MMWKENVIYYCKCYRKLYGVKVCDYDLYIKLMLGYLNDLDEL